ncbi:MAG: tripartite tricarboxylate transporter substrate binding protein [Alcaligenaceae bacterium]
MGHDAALSIQPRIRRRILGLVGRMLLLCLSPTALSAEFPERPIKLVSGSPAGGSTDAVARIMADGMGAFLNQSVVVVNQTGAGGNLATESLARAPGDGYTLMVGGNFTHGINPQLYKGSTYDPIKDFTPIGRVADLPSIIAVNRAAGITTLTELIAQAKKLPGKINYASGGNGTPAHIAGESLKRIAGIDLMHVPFRGGAAAVAATLSGDVEVIVGTPPVIMPHVKSGRLIALTVTWPQPYAVLPGVPSSTEAGLPQLADQGWFGIWGPAGIAQSVRQKLFEAINHALAQPRIQQRLTAEGLIFSPSNSTIEFEAFVKEEVPIWRQRVIDSGATVN